MKYRSGGFIPPLRFVLVGETFQSPKVFCFYSWASVLLWRRWPLGRRWMYLSPSY